MVDTVWVEIALVVGLMCGGSVGVFVGMIVEKGRKSEDYDQ